MPLERRKIIIHAIRAPADLPTPARPMRSEPPHIDAADEPARLQCVRRHDSLALTAVTTTLLFGTEYRLKVGTGSH